MPTQNVPGPGNPPLQVDARRIVLNLIQGAQGDVEATQGATTREYNLTTANPQAVVETDVQGAISLNLLPHFGVVQVTATW